MPQDIIQLLPDSIANQIAAGEVVQRPASVVKELLENAVDAGSTEVQVIIKEAGKSLIQIVDNGKGMSENDARMSFERHATSKIRKSEDLFTVRTMGFRGEALASIAAVAQVELRTKTAEEELGVCIHIEASEIKKQDPVSCVNGTSISVKNLFYNVPARRNFLRSNAVETRHIIDEFQRVALAHPDLSFSLYQNDLEVYGLPAGKLSQRIVGMFGKNYQRQLAACTEETSLLKIHGYIGKPEHAKKTRGEQFFFANNRFIKSAYLNHAVLNAYQGLIADNSFPFYVLFIEIDPKHIDINVHPTKTEIKFDDERSIYAVVRAAVKQALGTHNIAPSIDYDQDVNFKNLQVSRLDYSKEAFGKEHVGKIHPSPLDKSNLENWERLFNQTDVQRKLDQQPSSNQDSGAMVFQSTINQHSGEPVDEPTKKRALQLHNRYIVTQVKSGLMIIDQVVAYERISYEKYMHALDNQSGASQQSLFPQTVELNAADFALVMDLDSEIRALGFIFNEFGKNTIVVNGVPTDLAGSDERDLFEGLIEQFKQNKSELSVSKKDNLARAMAKRTGLKEHQGLTEEGMESLIASLLSCSNPNYGPDGKKTFSIMTLAEVAELF